MPKKIIAMNVPPELLTKDPSPAVAELRTSLEAIMRSATDHDDVAELLPAVAFYEVEKGEADPDEIDPAQWKIMSHQLAACPEVEEDPDIEDPEPLV